MKNALFKSTIIQAIHLVKNELDANDIRISPEHAAEIALAWNHGYYVRWNPKYYVRPYIPKTDDQPLVICVGNPDPNPGPFRMMINDIELTHSSLTKKINEKIISLLQNVHRGF